MYNWKNKNVLVTGVNGFVGSNLCKKLLNLKANIFGTINNNSTTSLLNYENLSHKINILNIEKNNSLSLKEIIKNYEINHIYHLAAQVEVIKANKDPYFTIRNNINYTLDLLEAARLAKTIEFFYFASTDKVYGEIEINKLPYKEEYIPEAIFPYDVSKYISEILVNCYQNNYSIPLIIGRTCNLYGPGQLNFSALIPSLIKIVINNEKFKPRSNGKTTRDYMFIEDWIETLVNLPIYVKKGNKKLIYNFGNNNPISTLEISKKIFNIMKYKKNKEVIKDFNKFKMNSYKEISNQFLDSTKAKKDLNFKTKISIDQGLKKTIQWYKKFI